jgi:hypothetical protein
MALGLPLHIFRQTKFRIPLKVEENSGGKLRIAYVFLTLTNEPKKLTNEFRCGKEDVEELAEALSIPNGSKRDKTPGFKQECTEQGPMHAADTLRNPPSPADSLHRRRWATASKASEASRVPAERSLGCTQTPAPAARQDGNQPGSTTRQTEWSWNAQPKTQPIDHFHNDLACNQGFDASDEKPRWEKPYQILDVKHENHESTAVGVDSQNVDLWGGSEAGRCSHFSMALTPAACSLGLSAAYEVPEDIGHYHYDHSLLESISDAVGNTYINW